MKINNGFLNVPSETNSEYCYSCIKGNMKANGKL